MCCSCNISIGPGTAAIQMIIVIMVIERRSRWWWSSEQEWKKNEWKKGGNEPEELLIHEMISAWSSSLLHSEKKSWKSKKSLWERQAMERSTGTEKRGAATVEWSGVCAATSSAAGEWGSKRSKSGHAGEMRKREWNKKRRWEREDLLLKERRRRRRWLVSRLKREKIIKSLNCVEMATTAVCRQPVALLHSRCMLNAGCCCRCCDASFLSHSLIQPTNSFAGARIRFTTGIRRMTLTSLTHTLTSASEKFGCRVSVTAFLPPSTIRLAAVSFQTLHLSCQTDTQSSNKHLSLHRLRLLHLWPAAQQLCINRESLSGSNDLICAPNSLPTRDAHRLTENKNLSNEEHVTIHRNSTQQERHQTRKLHVH